MSAFVGYSTLVGIGSLFTIVVGTYVMAYLIDCVCSSSVVERISSPVSNMAGLWGMTPEERRQILEKVFQTKKTIRNYHGNNKKARNNSTAFQKETTQPLRANKETEMTELTLTDKQISSTSSHETETEEATDDHSTNNEHESRHSAGDIDLEAGRASVTDNVTTVTKEEQIAKGVLQTQELSAESLENLCAICLVEYENGDRILSGTSCSHFFHSGCIMEWMAKGHDHCPFCREPMLSPQDMRQGAVESLGRKRVEELSCNCTPPMLRPSPTTAATIPAPTSSFPVVTGSPSAVAAGPVETGPQHHTNNNYDGDSHGQVVIDTDDAESPPTATKEGTLEAAQPTKFIAHSQEAEA